MPRYFIEVSYKGTNYSGFQRQDNANSIQQEIEHALRVLFKGEVELTCSSRTDAGVHAFSNYFHTDTHLFPEAILLEKRVYNLNAILPADIVIKRILEVKEDMHARFDAKSRLYKYYIYQTKQPFIADRAYFYPFTVDLKLLQEAAQIILTNIDFTSFSKKHTQVYTYNCTILESSWTKEGDTYIYAVRANRFLRGMVRGLVGTMLRVATGRISMHSFKAIIASKDCTKVDFSTPPHGLFLCEVQYEL